MDAKNPEAEKEPCVSVLGFDFLLQKCTFRKGSTILSSFQKSCLGIKLLQTENFWKHLNRKSHKKCPKLIKQQFPFFCLARIETTHLRTIQRLFRGAEEPAV